MPQITYSRNWKGPRPGVSTFSIDTTGDAEAIIIEDRLLQYLVSSRGPLEGLSNYKQQPKGPTYLEFLQLNKHFLNTIQFQFCNAMKDYTGNPFKLDLVTKEVTIDQESMQAIVKGAFPACGVAKPSVSVTNNEDILTFWVRDCLAAKVKAPPSKFFSFKKKKRLAKFGSAEDYSLGSGLTSAAILAQKTGPDEEEVVEPGMEDFSDTELDKKDREQVLPKIVGQLPKLPKEVDSRNIHSAKDPRTLALHSIFGELVGDKAQQHRLLLISHPSAREELLQKFSWVPADPELTLESRSRSVPFDLLDINFRIICVLPEDFPRALAYPWPFRAIRFFDGIDASADPIPTYLPDLQRITFDVLDVEKDKSFFSNLLHESPPLATTMIHHMRNKFTEKRCALEASREGIQRSIDHLQGMIDEPAPSKPSMQNFSQGNGNAKDPIDTRSSCGFDLACRVMRCPGICINNCEVLEKDEEGFFYYQLPGSTERLRKCANCTCSLSLHKIQPRAVSLVNRPFSLADTKDSSTESSKLKVEAQRKRKQAENLAQVQEAHQARMNEWLTANQNRAPKIAKMESDLADLNLQLQKLALELTTVEDCCARWNAALENWNDKNPPDKALD